MLRGELFATDMVRAYQEGRKLHTARPIKVPASMIYDVYPDGSVWGGTELDNGKFEDIGALAKYFDLSKHRPGDYIYCRETWTAMRNMEMGHVDYFFAAIQKDYDTISSTYLCDDDGFDTGKPFPWKPSIHMPREAARLFFRVSQVEVMRLEDVTEEFAREDGFLPGANRISGGPFGIDDDPGEWTALDAFMQFWRSTYGDASWMWVYWTEPVTREEAEGGDE